MIHLKTVLLSLLILSIAPFSMNAEDTKITDEISIIAVKMDADWCGKCKVMNPKLDAVMPEFKDEPVLFVKFNMTDEFTTRQAGFLADRLNLKSLFNEHKGQTGYVVLIDANSGEPLKTLQSDLSETQIKAEIQSVL
ncbi:MAG: thioredoxin [Balneolaceae bacterium]|nr:MAG: thioredoxin [Balneolaceae bacterium]